MCPEGERDSADEVQASFKNRTKPKTNRKPVVATTLKERKSDSKGALPMSIKHCTGGYSLHSKARKKISGMHSGKEEIINSFWT